jgi:putative ABC transport system permease protein
VGTRTRKIYRDIVARKARTALVSISIFIGVLGVVTLVGGGDLLISRIYDNINPDDMPMFGVSVSPKDGVDPATLDRDVVVVALRDYPGVTEVQGWMSGDIYWREPDDSGFIQGRVRNISDLFGDMTMQPVKLIEGSYPVPGQHELMIERRTAKRYGLAVGEPVVVRLLSQLQGQPGAAMAVPEQTWTISGIVFHPYVIESGNQSFYARYEDVQNIAGTEYYQWLQLRMTSYALVREDRYKIEPYIEDNTPYDVFGTLANNPANNEYVSEMEDWIGTLRALAIVAMLVSSFLVVTVVTTIVIEQRRQIGIMKSMGATRFDNFRIYAGIAVMYGVIGTIPGVLLGIPAAFLLANKIAPLMGVLIDSFSISLTGVLTGLIMGILMPFFAALLPVVLGTRVTILEAISDFGITSRYGHGPMAHVIRALPLPVTVRQALANIYQKKWRLVMTGVTLTLAVGAFMGVTGVFISLDNALDDIFSTFNTDLGIYPDSSHTYNCDDVWTLIESSVDGLNGIYPSYNRNVEIVIPVSIPGRVGVGEMVQSVDVVGFDTRSDSIRLNLQEGQGWQDNPDREGIVLSQSVADAIGKGVGDTITIRREDHSMDVKIIGIEKFLFDTAFMPWQMVAALDGETEPRAYVLRFEGNPSGAAVDRKIGAIREMLLSHGFIAYFDNTRAFEDEQGEIVLTAGAVFNIASLVMAAVGAIGLLTMLFISVFERQREIGVMRSVGASSGTIVSQFLTEGLMIGGIAWLIGVPLSYGVAEALTSLLPVGEFRFSYPPIAAGIGLLGMLIIAGLASIWPSLSASRRTVSDILRYQ